MMILAADMDDSDQAEKYLHYGMDKATINDSKRPTSGSGKTAKSMSGKIRAM